MNVSVSASGEEFSEIGDSLQEFKDYILAQTLAKDIVLQKTGDAPAGREVEWGDAPIYIDVKKI